ncbi:sensor domain CHASE-containing protein [Terrimicrobium sacchariphilum]|uniref:Sensor domain CHASE-containing protein n=1 Tax=Terrimicrobium sacchariphilum TaxID=690879 RepID=A0A146GE54_TERSA|nr:CHASE4 domain-containing protein [Terrimicrobium sacchariphilum]GAT34776.1 sensor domain CHASE-containing protein [Terrimicrobium sacchariphilum]
MLTRRGSLRFRIGLIVGGAMLLFAGVFLVLSSWILTDYFGRVQNNFTREHLTQFATVLNREAKSKLRLVRDYAQWDEAYNYMRGQSPGFLEENFLPEVNTSGQDLILFFDPSKRLHSFVCPFNAPQVEEMPEGVNIQQIASSRLLATQPRASLIETPAGLMLLAASPITRSNPSSGESAGWLVFGLFLTPPRLSEMAQVAGISNSGHPFPKEMGASDQIRSQILTDILGPVTISFPSVFANPKIDEGIDGSINFRPLSDDGEMLISIKDSATIYLNAMERKNWVLILSAAGIIAIVGIGFIVIDFFVTRPISQLDTAMQKMSSAPAAISRIEDSRDDEIGRLAASANSLLGTALMERRDAIRQRELLASILDSAFESILAFHTVRDADSRIVNLELAVMNHSAERLFSISAADGRGKYLTDLFPNLANPAVFDRFRHAIDSHMPLTFEQSAGALQPSGWYHFSATPWEEGLVITINDITERKQREQELAKTYAEMDRFNAAMVGREERIIAIKKEVNDLRGQLNLPPTYNVEAYE